MRENRTIRQAYVRKYHGGDMSDARTQCLTQPGQSGAWVEIDDNELMVYVDLDCTAVPNLNQFVSACHHLAGELGYGITFNGAP